MRFVRFRTDKNEELKGIIDGACIRQIYGSYLQAFTVTGNTFSLDTAALLPPVVPQNIICVDKDGSIFAKAPASLAGSGSALSYSKLYCTPRVAYIVKNRDHSSLTGVSLFGMSMMLDFAYSYNGFTVLGPCVDTEYTDSFNFNSSVLAHNMDTEKLKELSANISFRPGDIIAFALADKERANGRLSLKYADVELYAEMKRAE